MCSTLITASRAERAAARRGTRRRSRRSTAARGRRTRRGAADQRSRLPRPHALHLSKRHDITRATHTGAVLRNWSRSISLSHTMPSAGYCTTRRDEQPAVMLVVGMRKTPARCPPDDSSVTPPSVLTISDKLVTRACCRRRARCASGRPSADLVNDDPSIPSSHARLLVGRRWPGPTSAARTGPGCAIPARGRARPSRWSRVTASCRHRDADRRAVARAAGPGRGASGRTTTSRSRLDDECARAERGGGTFALLRVGSAGRIRRRCRSRCSPQRSAARATSSALRARRARVAPPRPRPPRWPPAAASG